ncbi:MAG: hypothetical protein AAGK97_14970, partial [Bacteroidota bacterium]
FVKVLQTQHVFDFLKIGKEISPIPENEINILKKVVGEFKDDINLTSETMVAGEPVEIVSGNLTGLKGKYLKSNGKKNFLIELENIGYNLIMEVESSLLRRLSRVSA